MEPAAGTAAVTALTAVAAGLLVLSGLLKVPSPDLAMASLHRLHLPSGRAAARALGAAEVVVGTATILLGGPVAALVLGVTYLALVAVAAIMRTRQVACGCFGSTETAVSRAHLAVNGLGATVGLIGVLAPPVGVAAVVGAAGPLGAAAGLVLLATAVGLLRVVLVDAAERTRTA